jgi:hypothetical protein
MNFYLIRLPKRSIALYTDGERLRGHAIPDSDQPIDRWILHLESKPSRWAHFLKELIILVRDTYYKLESRIDPMERVFKRLRHASRFTLYCSPVLAKAEALERFENLLIRQRTKHAFWIGVDFVFTVAAIVLSPVLIPLPGPNLFLYYPGLRLLSHYLAWRGTGRGLRLKPAAILPMAEISDIEQILNQRTPRHEFERLRELARRMKLDQLPSFLQRYG